MTAPRMLSRRFRRAYLYDEEDMVEVLTESFGSKDGARLCVGYLALVAEERQRIHRAGLWIMFTVGVVVGVAVGVQW